MVDEWQTLGLLSCDLDCPMDIRDDLTLTLHGLDEFNRDVDGEVFARKFFKFMQGLAEADRAANGRRRHKFLISALEKNTATAAVREQVSIDSDPAASSVEFYEKGLSAIYEDSPTARNLPRAFVKYVVDINRDVGVDFHHGEIKRRATGKIIYIDQFLQARAKRVLADINRNVTGALPLYKGIAHGAFDGVLEVLDSRDGQNRAVLTLTAGGKQINCVIVDVPEDEIRAAWKRRCVVRGLAHYDGESGLPVRIDVRNVHTVRQDIPPLTEWRGAFNIPLPDDESWY